MPGGSLSDMLTAVLLSVALVAYIAGFFLAILGVTYRSEAARVGANVVLSLGWLAHLATIVTYGVDVGHIPVAGGAEYLLALGLAIMTLHLLLVSVWRVHAAGIVLPPLAALAAVAALALLPEAGAPVAALRPLFLLHTTVSTLGMATLIVALAMSLIYLYQDRALKSRRGLHLLERLPPLDRCDHIGLQALLVGFVLLTLGILTGVVMNKELHERLFVPGVKQTLPLLAWIVFASVLVARFKIGFRGRKSAYLTITGVMLGLLTIVGMTI
jgi:ABC-type uncharacterized transport system permease subunit